MGNMIWGEKLTRRRFHLNKKVLIPCQHCFGFGTVCIRMINVLFTVERRLMEQADLLDKRHFNKDMKDTKDIGVFLN